MRAATLRLLLAAVFLCAVVACEQQDTIRGAEALYREGQYQLAADEYLRFIRDNPKSPILPTAYLGQAWSLYKLDNFIDAGEALDIMLRRYPESPLVPNARYLFVLCRIGEHRHVEAITLLRALIQEYPGASVEADARFQLARSELAMRRYGVAAEDFTAFLAKYPDSQYAAEALLGLAQAEEKLARWSEAASTLDRFITRYPRNAARPGAMFDLARYRIAAGEFEAAEKLLLDLERAYPAWPRFRETRWELAELYLLMQRPDSAVAVLRDLHATAGDRKDSEAARLALRLAQYHAGRGETDAARTYYARLATDYAGDPQYHPLALAWLAEDELAQGRRDIAIASIQSFLETYSDHPLADRLERELIDVLIASGRVRDGRNLLARKVRRHFTIATAADLVRLASLDIELADYQAAREEAYEGVRRAERAGDTVSLRSGLYYEMIVCQVQNDMPAAIQAYWKLLKVGPTYLTATEKVYWDAQEEQFYHDNRQPIGDRERRVLSPEWQISVTFGGIDFTTLDSGSVSLVTAFPQVLIASLGEQEGFRYVAAEKVRLLAELCRRREYDNLPDTYYPLRSTIGTDWIVFGNVTREMDRPGGRTVVFRLVLLRVDYGGLFPFEYYYYFTPDEAVNATPMIVRETIEKLKLYRPER